MQITLNKEEIELIDELITMKIMRMVSRDRMLGFAKVMSLREKISVLK